MPAERFPSACPLNQSRAFGGLASKECRFHTAKRSAFWDLPMKSPHRIDPTAVYDAECLLVVLSLNKHTLAREIRLGRLRVAKRSGRYFFLGEWLIEWLRNGELRRNLLPSP
jgi:hypothetical protein